jgi:hypothetical protein
MQTHPPSAPPLTHPALPPPTPHTQRTHAPTPQSRNLKKVRRSTNSTAAVQTPEVQLQYLLQNQPERKCTYQRLYPPPPIKHRPPKPPTPHLHHPSAQGSAHSNVTTLLNLKASRDTEWGHRPASSNSFVEYREHPHHLAPVINPYPIPAFQIYPNILNNATWGP